MADKVTGSCHILDLGGVRKSLIFLRKHRMDCSLRRCSFRKFLQILLHDRGSFFIRAFFSGKADEHSLSDKYFFYQLLQFFGYRLRILFHLFIQSADHLIVCNTNCRIIIKCINRFVRKCTHCSYRVPAAA